MKENFFYVFNYINLFWFQRFLIICVFVILKFLLLLDIKKNHSNIFSFFFTLDFLYFGVVYFLLWKNKCNIKFIILINLGVQFSVIKYTHNVVQSLALSISRHIQVFVKFIFVWIMLCDFIIFSWWLANCLKTFLCLILNFLCLFRCWYHAALIMVVPWYVLISLE